MPQQRSPSQNLLLAAASATAVAATYFLSLAISRYGLNGLLRLIWEGDHLPPDVRESVDALYTLESDALPKEECNMERVQVTIETVLLNSVDDEPSSGAETKTILEHHPQIRRDLSMLSYRLDAIAADVDSVLSCGNADVKMRKKQLSDVLVRLMKKTDSLIALCGGTK